MIIAGANKENPFFPFPNEFYGNSGLATKTKKISIVDLIVANAFPQTPRPNCPIKLSASVDHCRALLTDAKRRPQS